MTTYAAAGDNILPGSVSGGSHLDFTIAKTSFDETGTTTITAAPETGYTLPADVSGWSVSFTSGKQTDGNTPSTAAATCATFTRNSDTSATATITVSDIGSDGDEPMTAALGGSYAGVAKTYTVSGASGAGLATKDTDYVLSATSTGTTSDIGTPTFDSNLDFYVNPTAGATAAGKVVTSVKFTSAATDTNAAHTAATDATLVADGEGKYTIPADSVTGNITIAVTMGAANTLVDVTTSAPLNVTAAVTEAAGWDAETHVWSSGDLSVTYRVANTEDYAWGVAPEGISQFYASINGAAPVSLSTIDGAALSVTEGVATVTLPEAMIQTSGTTEKTIALSADITAVAKDGGVTVSPNTTEIDVKAGEAVSAEDYTFTAAVAGNNSPTITWGLYSNTDGAANHAASIDGLTLSGSGTTATLSGTPTDPSQSGTYFVVAKSGEQLGYARVTVSIAARDADVINVSGSTGTVDIGVQSLDFGEEAVGYGAITGKTVYVKNKGTAAIENVTFAMSGGNNSSFTISPTTVTRLAKNQVVAITITPKTGLSAKAAGYGETLVLTSKAFSGTAAIITDAASSAGTPIDNSVKIADATFTVTDDISFYVGGVKATLTDTPWAEAASDGSKEFLIGTYKVGEKMSAVEIKASETGSSQGLTFDMDETDGVAKTLSLTPFSDTLILSTSSIKNTRSDASTSWASFQLLTSNEILAAAYDYSAANVTAVTTRTTHNDAAAITAAKAVRVAYDTESGKTLYYLPIHVTDNGGVARDYYGIIEIEPTDAVSVKVEETAMTNGGTYAWTDTTNNNVTVTITNNSKVDLTFSAVEEYGVGNGVLSLDDSALKAAAENKTATSNGGTATFTVKAAAASDAEAIVTINGGSSASGSTGENVYSVGVAPFSIDFDFTKKGDHIRITSPSDIATTKASTTTSTLTKGNYAASYSFQFTASEGAKWYLLDNDATLTNSTAIDGTITEEGLVSYWYNSDTSDSASSHTTSGITATPSVMSDTYGLSLNPNTGVLSGTILSKEADGKVLAVLAVKNDGSEAVIGYYKLSVAGAEKALKVVEDSTGKTMKSDAGLELTSTTDGGEIVKTFTVTNTSDVDLSNLTLQAVAPEAGPTDNKADVTLKWVNSAGGKVDSIDIGSGESATLQMTIADDAMKTATAKTTYGHKVTVKDGDAIFTFPVDVEVSTRPVIQTPSGTGNTATTISKDDNGDAITVNTEITAAKGIQLTAIDAPSGALIDTANTSWSWKAQEGSTLPAGLSISGNKIVGTPTKTGDYLVTITVTNNTNGDHKGEQASADFTLSVAGGTTIAANGKGAEISTDNNAYTAPFLFNGVVAGSSEAPSALNVTVENEGTAATGTLNIKIEDAVNGSGVPKRADDTTIPAGSKNKFDLSTTTLASITAGNDRSFTITPNETVASGTYNAKVTIYGDGVKDTSFFVQYTVADEMALSDISSKLSKNVGDPVDQSFLSVGAGATRADGTAYDTNGQGTKWYLNVKKDGVIDKESTDTLLTEMGKIGFTRHASTAGTIDTEWTPSKGYEINGGKFVVTALDGAGEFAFNVYAETYAAYAPANNGALINLPAQHAEESITMTVAPTSKIYVKDTDNYENGTVTSTAITGSADKKVTAYTFKEQPANKYTVADVKDTITVKNAGTVDLKVNASIVNEDGTENTDFVIFDATALNTAISAGADGTFKIKPGSVWTANGVHSAYILLEADETDNPGAFEDIMIPISLTVATPTYTYEIFADGDEEETALTELNLGSMVKGNAETITFTMKNTGNADVEANGVKFTEVLDAEGTELGGSDTHKLATPPVTTITAGNMKRGDEADFDITPVLVSSVGEQTAYLKVDFDGDTTARIYKVTYTVISDDVSATLDPNGTVSLTSKKENYSAFDETFTIKNTGTLDTDVLKDVTVTLSGHAAFALDDTTQAIIAENGSDIFIPSLAKGDKATFKVNVADGLSMGTYAATVTVNAANLKSAIVANLTFKVTADSNLSVEASTAGKTVTGSRATRLMATLDALAPTNVTAGKDGVYCYTKYNAGSPDGTYYINLNGTASDSDYDVTVTYSAPGSVPTATIQVGAMCDLTGATATLTNSEYESADLGTTFQKVNFTIYRTVTVNVNGSTGTPALMVDGEKVTWESIYGTNHFTVVYEVENGSKISEATGTVTDGVALDNTMIGLPELIFDEDEYAFDAWFDDDAKEAFAADATISQDYASIIPKQHTRTYKKAKAGETGYVSWSWADDYSTATLKLVCDDGDFYETYDNLTGDVVITSEVTKLTCTQDGSTKYTAAKTVDGVKYEDVQTSAVTKHSGHSWVYVADSIKWSADKSTATISLECQNDNHDAAIDGAQKIRTNVAADSVTPVDSTAASCLVEGTYKNYAVWYDRNEDGTINTGKVLYSATSGTITGYGEHKYSTTGTFSWTFPTGGMPTASLTVKCQNAPSDSSHNLVVSAEDVTVTLDHEYESNGSKVYKAYYYLDKDHIYTELKTVKSNGDVVSGDDKTLVYDGFISSFTYTGSAITQPYLQVYWGSDLLTLNKDYTLKYADNKEVGVATVTITGKGNYAETKVLNYSITARDISEDYGFAVIAGTATKTAVMPYKETATAKPKLTYNNKTLKIDTDYYISDPEGAGYGYDENGVKTVTLTGIGNFTGSTTAKIYAVDNKNVLPTSKLTVKIDATKVASTTSYEPVYPNSVTISYGKNYTRTLTKDQMVADEGTGEIGNDDDVLKFQYAITNNYIPGTASIQIYTDSLITVDTGKQMIGSVTKTYKIAGQSLAKAEATYTNAAGNKVALDNKTEVPYLGTAEEDAYTVGDFTDFTVTLAGTELTMGMDYVVVPKNNAKAGTATFQIIGLGAYTGSKTNKTFKIVKPTFKGNTEVTVTFTDGTTSAADKTVEFVQGGAKPKIEAINTYSGEVLTEGVDYTLSYKNNTKVNEVASVIVTGKGNYQGKNDATLTFKVGQRTMTWDAEGIANGNSLNVTRTDIKFNSNKVNLYTNYLKGKKPVINEVVGCTDDGFEVVKKLTAKNDYNVSDTWYYGDGTAVGVNDTIDAATQIYGEDGGLLIYAEITFNGTSGKYVGDAVMVPVIWIYGTQLKANMIEVNQNIFFTGDRITQESVEGGIITNLNSDEYEIVGYKNNVKQGTATVTVRGWGKYGGTVNKTFRIQKANINKQ